MKETSSCLNRREAVKWSLVFESFNQSVFNHSLTVDNVEQQGQVDNAQQTSFGRYIDVGFDQDKSAWVVSRSHLESELVYFFSAKNGLVISNDIVWMRSLADTHQLNKKWLLNFFSFTDDFTDESPIQGISILPALGQMNITSQGFEIKRQSLNQSNRKNTQAWTKEQWVEQWRSCSQQSIVASCQQHDDIAIMLSSGLDSGGIAAYLIDHEKTNSRPKKIKGFSWRFPNHSKADESEHIQALANHLGLQHEFIDIDAAECFADIANWPVSLDAPYFNAMRRIKSKLYSTVAEQNFTVLLNGHIGDELCFVDRYVLAELWRDNKVAWWEELATVLRQKGLNIRSDSSFRYWLKQRLNKAEKAFSAPSFLTDNAQVLYEKNALELNVPANNRSEQFGLLTANSELAAIATEQVFTKPYAIDRYHPYLNQELISLALTCPAYLLSTHEQTKWISRQALSGLLPKTFLNRSRIGQLDELFEQGLEENMEAIRDYLWRSERRWPEFIREDAVQEVLDQRRWDKAASIVVPCLGFERWLDEWQKLDLPVI